MKISLGTRSLKDLLFLFALLSGGHLAAQTFTIVHQFSMITGGGPNGPANADGIYPQTGLTLYNDTFYGTTSFGGKASGGNVFCVNSDGSGFKSLHDFDIGNDGGHPGCTALLLDSNVLYGTTLGGGTTDEGYAGVGTVFKVGVDGTGFAVLHVFPGRWEGIEAIGGLAISGTNLFGTTQLGGSGNQGIVFSVSTDGSNFTTLHAFDTAQTNSVGAYTNADGGHPMTSLLLIGNRLYGTTYIGTSEGVGSVFSLNLDGTGFETVHPFTGGPGGGHPSGGLLLCSNRLFGTTAWGGESGRGTIYSLNTDGSDFRTLYSFSGGTDGGFPSATLVSSGNSLYGATTAGGSFGGGTAFTIKIDGTDFISLYSLNRTTEGSDAVGNLVVKSNSLYGTAQIGGSTDNGTIFRISFFPRLQIAHSADLVLTWPTSYAGFDYSGYTLQSTTNLTAQLWTTNLARPVVLNGQWMVTNSSPGAQQFFRLTSSP